MSAKIIHTSCDAGEADDTEGDDQRGWMTAERMTQQGCDDQRGWMTAERMTQQGCDDQRSWMTIFD